MAVHEPSTRSCRPAGDAASSVASVCGVPGFRLDGSVRHELTGLTIEASQSWMWNWPPPVSDWLGLPELFRAKNSKARCSVILRQHFHHPTAAGKDGFRPPDLLKEIAGRFTYVVAGGGQDDVGAVGCNPPLRVPLNALGNAPNFVIR